MEVLREYRNDTRVLGGLVMLCKNLDHDHTRPPVVIALRTNHAIGRLMCQRPFDKSEGLVFQLRVIQQNREGEQAIQVVGATLPALACAPQPAAIWSDVRPNIFQMACKAV